MISIEQHWSRSDTIDIAYQRTSRDNGNTWSPPLERPTGERRTDGMLRRHPPLSRILARRCPSQRRSSGGFAAVAHLLRIAGGPVRQLIHKGPSYDARHPLPGVFTSRNCAMIGDVATQPLSMPDGSILLPVDISPIDASGALANPGGGYTYHDVAILHSCRRTPMDAWLGNITAQNPRGNRPRYPFWIGEVDRESGLLMRDSLRMVDTLQPGEDPQLSLSNFYAREDRDTHEICLHMTRLFASDKGWRGDAILDRIAVS